MKIVAHLLPPGDGIPNHPFWPLLIYERALESPDAEDFEALFEKNRWPAAWRNGVHPFHHFHPDGHEVLGVYSGEVTVLFGGECGVTVTAAPGDVIVLPAGTGHKKLSSRGSLGVVGAYPRGSHPGTSRKSSAKEPVAAVPLPACDPVCGPDGPLFTYWKA